MHRNVYLTSGKGTFWFAQQLTHACVNWEAGVYAVGSTTNIARFFTATDALQWLETQPNLSLVSSPQKKA